MPLGYSSCDAPSMPGRRVVPTPPGDQACGLVKGAYARHHSRDVTDPCGNAIAQTFREQMRLQPVCYRLATDPVGCAAREGYVVVDIQSDGSVVPSTVVVDAASTPIAGAILVPGCERETLPSITV